MLTRRGELEGLKETVHLGLFGLSLASLLYNIAAYEDRKAVHLGVNVAIYLGLTLFEAYQSLRHHHAR
jgi:hypothetical protein